MGAPNVWIHSGVAPMMDKDLEKYPRVALNSLCKEADINIWNLPYLPNYDGRYGRLKTYLYFQM